MSTCITDIGGGIGGPAGYNPDGSMRYMMDGGQQFTPPGNVSDGLHYIPSPCLQNLNM